MTRWVNFVFAVFGAFFLLGISGAFIGSLLNVSEVSAVSAAGFLAAFGVVSISYTSAPTKPKAMAAITFVFGSLVSWFLLKDFSYSKTSHFLSPEVSTYLPLMTTNLGGLLSLAIVFFPKSSTKTSPN